MTGRLVLPGTAPEADWLAARRRGVTASEIAVLMGLSPYGSPFELYHRKTGALPAAREDNDAMELGRFLEEFVCEKFGRHRPEFQVWGDGRTLYAHAWRDWQLATPDRFLFDAGHEHSEPLAVLEAKTSASYDGWGDDGTDEIPVHYRCQVLWQMDVLGVAAGFVACLFLHTRQLRIYELALDDDARRDLELMRLEAIEFIGRLPNGDFPGEPPEVDWRPATRDALKHLHPSVEDRDVYAGYNLARGYQAACRNLKAAERKKASYENQVRALLGNARRAVAARNGDVIATRQVYDLPAKTIERRACTVDKLVPAKTREHPS